MRCLAVVSSFALLASCAPVREPVPATPVKQAGEAKPVISPPAPDAPSLPNEGAKTTRREISGVVCEGLSFDSRSHRLAVVDQPDGPGSRFPDAAAAGRSRDGLAAVNAGFFTPEGAPLGLVIAAGKQTGSWNSASSLGSGVWHEDSSGRSAISRREKLGKTAASGMRELIQAGPMLVENAQPVSGLEATKTSARTIILWDGGYRWWIGRCSPCTLAELAAALASGGPASWPVRHALNLDGGRSADLWISDQATGGPVSIRPPWNRPVRNFLIVLPR